MKVIVLLMLFLSVYYMAVMSIFQDSSVASYPHLRERLGTVLWHSSDINGVPDAAYRDPNSEDHVYCFYPSPEAKYNKSGEYIIKRFDSLNDCKGWYGTVVIRESSWVSEREKIWWNEDQRFAETAKTKPGQV